MIMVNVSRFCYFSADINNDNFTLYRLMLIQRECGIPCEKSQTKSKKKKLKAYEVKQIQLRFQL